MKRLLSLLFVLCFYCSNAQVNLSSGLIAYYPFSGNANDASGNGNNATNFGATLTTDQVGNANSAYYFDGVNDYMQIAGSSSFDLLPQISLVAKVKVEGFYSGSCHGNCIIDKGVSDFVTGSFSLRFASNYNNPTCADFDTLHQNYCTRYDGGQPDYITASNPPYIAKDKWDCLVYTFDGTTHKMYVNAVLRYQYTGTSATATNTDDIFLGKKNSAQYPYWFKGVMDEVRIYNRPLNIQEVDSLCSLPPHGLDTSLTVSTINNVPAIINTLHGTLAMNVAVFPATANQVVTWSVVPGTGAASISSTGIVTAIADGTVWAKAVSNISPVYKDSMQIVISHQGANAVSEIEKNLGFNMYPIPANDALNVQMKGQHSELVIAIVDLSGRIIMARKVTANALNKMQPFSLKLVAPGTYILQIKGKDLTINKKFSKQ